MAAELIGEGSQRSEAKGNLDAGRSYYPVPALQSRRSIDSNGTRSRSRSGLDPSGDDRTQGRNEEHLRGDREAPEKQRRQGRTAAAARTAKSLVRGDHSCRCCKVATELPRVSLHVEGEAIETRSTECPDAALMAEHTALTDARLEEIKRRLGTQT